MLFVEMTNIIKENVLAVEHWKKGQLLSGYSDFAGVAVFIHSDLPNGNWVFPEYVPVPIKPLRILRSLFEEHNATQVPLIWYLFLLFKKNSIKVY